MSEKQGILKRLEYYADCIDKGIHVTGSQLKRLVLDIREQGGGENPVGWGPSYPQPWMVDADMGNPISPPAEAMEAWHSAMNDVGELRANAPDERYAKRAARVESWIKANRPEAPSAPVGVEGLQRYSMARGSDGERWSVYMDPDPAGEWVKWADAQMAALTAALAQKPAAAGEEIMVNAAHDVYTLPLQPSGLSSGPRFVVHVPGPEQPAAVDEADAEIERLRVEVKSLQTLRDVVIENHGYWKDRAERLAEALRGVLPFVVSDVLEHCDGNKCREQWCAGCMGDEYAAEQVERARAAAQEARAAMRDHDHEQVGAK